MKNLEKVQKTMNAFKTLTLIAAIFTFTCALFTFAGSMTLFFTTGFEGLNDLLNRLPDSITLAVNMNPVQLREILLSFALCCALDGVLLIYAYRYFKAELGEGTPFTQAGADRIRMLGVRCIMISLVSAVVPSVIYASEELEGQIHFGNAGGLVLGICLILLSIVLRYGAELEYQTKTK